jgi:uncharacterized membrane protein YhaH (DUF805 family)
VFHFLFSFRGRISLGQFWLFYVGAGICWGIAVAAIYGIAGYAGIPDPLDSIFFGHPLSAGGWCVLSFLVIAYAFLVICFMTVISKRLHDRNRSAWWLVGLYGLFAAVSQLDKILLDAQFVFDGHRPLVHGVWLFGLLALGIATVWIMLELFILPGTRGENRFGPDPRRIDPPKTAA